MQNDIERFEKPNLNNGLVLYFNPYNFHSQKVLLVLYEKQIDFQSHAMDLSRGEQFSSWFLALNPKGDVPVLQDDCFVIPDSCNIVNYLESKYKTKLQLKGNFNSGNNLQCDKKIDFMEKVINRLPIGAITLGSFIHSGDLKLNPKPPFVGPIRKMCLHNNDKITDFLKSCLLQETGLNLNILQKKIELHEKRKEIVYNLEEFQKLLNTLQTVLIYVNRELEENQGQEWLISDNFSIADISLGLLLYRLCSIGFEDYFWMNGKLPFIEKYYAKFTARSSFKKITPNSLSVLRDMWTKAPSSYRIGAGALGMAMFAVSAFAHKVG